MNYPADAPDPQQLLDTAIEAAVSAGTHALDNAARRHETVACTEHDVKLRLDIECQQVAERIVRARFPRHHFLGEEHTGTEPDPAVAADSPYQWIVDPIDGTVNFTHGLPFWCCSVACRKHDTTQAGAVYAPALNQLYQASLETTALCNGQPIRVSDVDSLTRAMTLSAMDIAVRPGHEPLCLLRELALNTRKSRILGSAALDLCMVASGKADGYFEASIFLWDIAAGALIVRRAGGIAEALRNPGPDHRLAILATNGRIHDQLKALLQPHL